MSKIIPLEIGGFHLFQIPMSFGESRAMRYVRVRKYVSMDLCLDGDMV
jgi:hypothetical protein